jgi:hypothetical protein
VPVRSVAGRWPDKTSTSQQTMNNCQLLLAWVLTAFRQPTQSCSLSLGAAKEDRSYATRLGAGEPETKISLVMPGAVSQRH